MAIEKKVKTIYIFDKVVFDRGNSSLWVFQRNDSKRWVVAVGASQMSHEEKTILVFVEFC